MGLSISEDMKRACLCPLCLEIQKDVKKDYKKINDVNGYTHPFKKVNCQIKKKKIALRLLSYFKRIPALLI